MAFNQILLKLQNAFPFFLILGLLSCLSSGCEKASDRHLSLHENDHIVLVGNNLGSRMLNFGHFETEMYVRYPDSSLVIRNMCDGGNTPGFRPHSGRVSPWAFPGAENFQTELAHKSGSQGHFETPDEWITRLEADIIVGFFGYNESFQGEEGLENYKAELAAFIEHTLQQKYNGQSAPQLALVSPIAFEDLSDRYDLPDGVQENINLQLYTKAMQEVADSHQVLFVDVYTPSKAWIADAEEPLTTDGFQLTDAGYEKLGPYLVDKLFGDTPARAEEHREMIHAAVMEKNWLWHNDYKIPNGVHVFGRRYNPFGPDNYPAELAKIREMTAIRDQAIWQAVHGEKMDLAAADAKTSTLPPVETNYTPQNTKNGDPNYLYGEDALSKFTMAPGYQVELFASEEDFPDLANPVQIAFDNQGRLWVAVMPSYPHYKPGDQRPDDKLLILEDTDGDGKADKQTIFKGGLHLPTGFEFAPEGVYIAQGTNLMLYTDTDGDDHADTEQIIMSGFDDHDSHHVISAFTADPSGAFFMGEGVFLHTNVETPYGPVRGTNGGFYRYNPQRRHLERTAQIPIPNPWGIAVDKWGQPFFAETSGPDIRWMTPGTIKPLYGVSHNKSFSLVEEEHRVRPTSGLEFVSSRHFPDEVQGDMLVNNTIGFLGMKQHQVIDDTTGYRLHFRHNLIQSSDGNFRPVDMEFAPDGSLYLVDWHNVLIGHMQHNARDPLRDHQHGRIYRITYPSRPLVDPAPVAGASIEQLLENLKLPEYRTRYRSRRELRGRDADEVLHSLRKWVDNLDRNDPQYEHHMLEGMWVSWGLNRIEPSLLKRLLKSDDYRVRASAVRTLRYVGHQIPEQTDLLIEAARDDHGRVRMEAVVAASWLKPEAGAAVLDAAEGMPMDRWLEPAFATARAHLNGRSVEQVAEEAVKTNLKGTDLAAFTKGKEIYEREGFCATCHQEDGKGLDASGFPPLADTKWVLGDEERLVKIVLNGLYGPIEVKGKTYPGQVPMTPYRGLLNDEEIAAVLTYVRNAFNNEASIIKAETVKKVRDATADKTGFYSPEELLKDHPL
ncbi:PVC-type heme-binding CxxCH protein [Flavilitoribacter nigricans]|uniref:Dehydrogenase n=1 Tax=Flavilitoribacter nigricans (strain ATCC 23147 / DSM 23189 / NBRC 102662 / NCIMB 1420 / SS-2) TaxID=1122177 RepID=A0A2D0N5E4_FLAN2|nr:PVC-type heme-binding CxxCH protein [Flavilitoribacter nigricans]PHN03379.1 dehydrogenase [Flavilitoribacter nigricans DSM 23189 = NBRC 102662]